MRYKLQLFLSFALLAAFMGCLSDSGNGTVEKLSIRLEAPPSNVTVDSVVGVLEPGSNRLVFTKVSDNSYKGNWDPIPENPGTLNFEIWSGDVVISSGSVGWDPSQEEIELTSTWDAEAIASLQKDSIDNPFNIQVAWLAAPAANIEAPLVYFWNGDSVIRLTSEFDSDRNLRLSETRLVWLRGSGTSGEVYAYENQTYAPATSNSLEERDLMQWDELLAWTVEDGAEFQVRLQEGNEPVEIIHRSDLDVYNPSASDELITWGEKIETQTSSYISTIFVKHRDSLNNNPVKLGRDYNEAPQASLDNVFWFYNAQLSKWNHSEDSTYNTFISGTNLVIRNLSVWDGKAAGYYQDGNKQEIFFWDGIQDEILEVSGLDNSPESGTNPYLHGNQLVWLARLDDEQEVYHMDMENQKATNLTQSRDSYTNPRVYERSEAIYALWIRGGELVLKNITLDKDTVLSDSGWTVSEAVFPQ